MDNVTGTQIGGAFLTPITMRPKFGALSSSEDPQKLADTVRGLILTFSAIILVVGTKLGVPLTENAVAMFAEQTGLAVGSLWFLYGLVKKAIVFFATRK